jgi:hypothetical protein
VEPGRARAPDPDGQPRPLPDQGILQVAVERRAPLLADGKASVGVQTDPLGRFWRFDVQG